MFQEVEEIITFIKKHLKVEYIITDEPQRTERFDYPLDAIREIVINMIVHRDYRDSSASIIKIFDDRIEFFNPGKLYDGLTIQKLLSGKYTSKSRNKLIAKAFKETGMIERYGSGIMRVRTICKEYGIKEPVFSEDFNGFMVTIFNERASNVPENRVDSILKLIKKNKDISTLELSKLLNVNQKTIKRDMQILRTKGIIERIGPDKGGYWKIL